jgi:hypothetical protein
MTTTYYEVFTAEDKRIQEALWGTEEYGYSDLDEAIAVCPIEGYVQERFIENGADWAGGVVFVHEGECA